MISQKFPRASFPEFQVEFAPRFREKFGAELSRTNMMDFYRKFFKLYRLDEDPIRPRFLKIINTAVSTDAY